MFNWFKSLADKFFIDILWNALKWIASPILAGGYIMGDWIGGILLGLGTFGIFSYLERIHKKIKNINTLEGKTYFIFEPRTEITVDISKDSNTSIVLPVILYNGSNQIIYFELVENQNYVKIGGILSHSLLNIDKRSHYILPYKKFILYFQTDTLDLKSSKELELDIQVSLKYKQNEIIQRITKNFNVIYKVQSNANEIKLTLYKNHSSQ